MGIPPDRPLAGSASNDEASFRTRWLAPDGEGRPTTALTRALSDPSPFGPQPDAPGTANVSSPCTIPVTWSDASGPLGSGVPPGSKKTIARLAPDRSVFSGCRTIGSCSEPMKQLGPRSTDGGTATRWILTGSVRIGTPTESPADRSKSDGAPADWRVAMAVCPETVTVTGSAMIAPPGGPMVWKMPAFRSAGAPICRLLFPVVVTTPVVPSVMLP